MISKTGSPAAVKGKLWSRDFSLVVIGQIISLFGNAILRFALPLYLLSRTGSAALFGAVTACSMIPMILMSPIGGICADRVNKRNIMVILDFSTSALVIIFSLLLDTAPFIPLFLVTLMLLYGIQGAYQPAVQASIPALAQGDQIIPANAVINQVSSLASLIGPVAGGALYGFWGLTPILIVSAACFLCSAVMEIFIHIPFQRVKSETSVFQTVKRDLSESLSFIFRQKPVLAKTMMIVSAFNLFLTSLLMVGIPVLITQTLSFEEGFAEQLCGYAQGALAAGGLLGGILTGVLAKKLRVRQAPLLLLGMALMLVPIGAAFLLGAPPMLAYFILVACCFVGMACATMFSIQMMALIQMETPAHMVGKVISCVLALSMCSQPVGQALYGGLFEVLGRQPHFILFGAAAVSCVIAFYSKATFGRLEDSSGTAPGLLEIESAE